MNLDHQQIRRAFGRAAQGYEPIAVLQHQIEILLLERLEQIKQMPARVLDIGAGTGRASAAIKKHYPKSEVIALDLALPMLHKARQHTSWLRPFRRVCGDAHTVPIADGSMDLLFSNLCLQWCENLREVFSEFRRVLKPGGWLLFSSFGPDTLTELRQSWAAVDNAPHVNVFLDMHDIGDAMLAAGFKNPVLDVERYTLTYRDARSLMQELKAIGAGNAHHSRNRGLTGKTRLQQMLGHYEQFRSAEGLLPASYEVIFAQAQAPDDSQPRRNNEGEIASVPVELLRASLRNKAK